MTDETSPPPPTSEEDGGRIDRYLGRWRDGWTDHDDPVLPRPTTDYQGIDWADVADAHGDPYPAGGMPG